VTALVPVAVVAYGILGVVVARLGHLLGLRVVPVMSTEHEYPLWVVLAVVVWPLLMAFIVVAGCCVGIYRLVTWGTR
jgi:hypothetical protein